MIIYNKTTETFIARVKLLIREIMSNELNIELRRSRFLFNNYLYPIHIVVFEHSNILGYFSSDNYTIGLNKYLMFRAKNDVLKNIIRHELAHLLTFITHGSDCPSHGKQYREICKQYHWNKDVYLAKADLKDLNNKIEGDIDTEKLLSKIKKLLALAQSSNAHESQLATIKANQLLLKHNLNLLDSNIEEETCVLTVLESKRSNGKMRAIYQILKSFYVQPVLNYGKGRVYLEIIGNRQNVLIGEYVAHFLDKELESLWKKSKIEMNLKGTSSKNSFFLGAAKGFDKKMEVLTKDAFTNSKELILLKDNLTKHVNRVYPRMSASYDSTNTCEKSLELGLKAGKNLSINPSVKNSSLKNIYLK